MAKANPAHQERYEYSLNRLSGLYSTVKNYKEVYRINQEFILILKSHYESNPESFRSDYSWRLGNQSYMSIFMNQYQEAELLAREGLTIDSTQHWIATNLAAALLFQGKYVEAEKIYHQYKNEEKESFLDDFKQFSEAGVIPKEREADVEKIKRMLEE